ncbi:hypothetical protein PF001_g11748 [Phytophthora fragariae]|uniref:Crinkler effector protein N-terminal domain-containing protein n=1 Tax=Phytophthora fragariae TaxID=53985 RepID=A0A6A3KVK4_9STRA|nr:hypothetical protein PF011_g10281 [Phytophthora fragariae]KAE9307170.1 hypothetical protein PF001_g11748 [Phytophthora fragariae]
MWFELVDRNGEPLGPADKLHGPLGDVADFRRALKDSRSDSADLDGVEASLLKVYKDRKTYISRIALATNDPIARFGKQMETALIVEVPKVWFQLVDGGTRRPLEDAVCLPLANLRVEKLREAAKAKFSELFPKTVKASDLKVYESWEEYNKRTGGIPLLTDSSIENFGKSRETALIVEVPKVWFQLVDGGTRRAVTVYKSMQVYKDQVEGGLLSADSIVNEHGKTSRSALILEGPKYASLLRKRPGGDIRQLLNEDTTKRQNQEQLLSDFEMLTVNEDEFQLEELHSKQQSENPIVMTPGLHEFWEGFGSFPPYYFVRMEEVVFWQLIKKLLLDPKKRIVIVGSPGVGKSCFLMLVAFYLACVEKKKVLVIRRVKEKELESVVVLLDGQDRLKRLNEEIDKTPQLKGLRRVFVVVGPDSDIGNTFTLRDAPDQDAFLSCFDRDQLEPQHQEEQHPPPPSEE